MTISKKIVIIGILVATLLLALLGVTFAYYSGRTDDKVNTFSTGGVELEIDEKFPTPDPDNDLAKKEVRLKNIGSVRAYVRAIIVPTLRKDGVSYGCDVDYSYVNSDGYILVTSLDGESVYKIHLVMGWEENWHYHEKDNSFCYRHIVAPQQSTNLLLTHVTREGVDSWDKLNIDILGEALQTGGEDALDHLREVWGITHIGETGILYWS